MCPLKLPAKKRVKFFVITTQLLCCLFLYNNSRAQSKWVIENYNYMGQPGSNSIVPMVHLETKNNWYGELRYNYEDAQTISLYGGKTIRMGDKCKLITTPLVGFSAGTFSGISFGVNTDIEWERLYFSSQTQYSIDTKKDDHNFFFSWSEIGCNISKKIFAGLAMQYTLQKTQINFEPGFVAGIDAGNFSFPVYAFRPFHSRGYFVVGINYEYNIRNKKL